MFNPYAVRPIGSDRFIEHLKDLYTKAAYSYKMDNRLPREIHGSIPWRAIDIYNDPYTNLMTAIIANAMIEYLTNYEKKEYFYSIADDKLYWVYNSHCIQIENEYFRRSPGLRILFEKLLEEVCWEGMDAIKECKKRLYRVLRWTKKVESGEDK